MGLVDATDGERPCMFSEMLSTQAPDWILRISSLPWVVTWVRSFTKSRMVCAVLAMSCLISLAASGSLLLLCVLPALISLLAVCSFCVLVSGTLGGVLVFMAISFGTIRF